MNGKTSDTWLWLEVLGEQDADPDELMRQCRELAEMLENGENTGEHFRLTKDRIILECLKWYKKGWFDDGGEKPSWW